MKNKPERHKSTNTFKFQPFADRLNEIDIRQNALYHLEHVNSEISEGNETHFYHAMQKWNVLNLTAGYAAFRQEVLGIITLPQLLHKKDHVIEALLKHLRLANELSLQPLLELVVVLAKDLREDFYPHFQSFLEQLISLLNTKDPEQLEWTLICLAYLFKTLRIYLKKDISTVFISVLPLLADSKPQYINNFAAESFAFVARDIKDKRKFLGLILKTLKSRKDGITGCGRLFFEILRGVSGSFHSCAATFLPFLLESLDDEKLPQDVLFEVLTQTVANMLYTIHFKNSILFWACAYDCLDNFIGKWKVDNNQHAVNSIELLLKLIGQAVEHKNGTFLDQPVPLILKVTTLVEYDLPEEVLQLITQIGALLLLSNNVTLPQENVSKVITSILRVKHPKVLLSFVQNVLDYPQFEVLILPQFLRYAISCDIDDECLKILTKICTKKSPLCRNGINLNKWRRYSIDFGKQNKAMSDKFLKITAVNNEREIFDNVNNFLCAVICLAHLRNIEQDRAKSQLKNIINILCKSISQNVSDCNAAMEVDDEINLPVVKKNKMLIFILTVCIETAIHIDSDNVNDVFDLNVLVDILLPFVNDVTYLCTVNCLDLILTASSIDLNMLDIKMFDKINEVLIVNLSSPYHEMRLISTHIYTFFSYLPEFNNANLQPPQSCMFTLCHTVEKIKPSIQEYREQLQNLLKLSAQNPIITNLKNTEHVKIPLNYLFGVLYMNFKLLWEPILEIIASYSHKMTASEFWSLFFKHLQISARNVANKVDLMDSCDGFESDCSFMVDLFSSYNDVRDKPDFVNYRIMLWKCMHRFTDIIESKNRDVATLFLTFMEDEYKKTNADVASTWNVKQTSPNVDATVDMDGSEDEAEHEENEMIKEHKSTKLVRKTSEKSNYKTLVAHMSVFAKLRSPRSIYREPELYKIYLDFLCSKNPDIQKTALDCIMTYKHKYLMPYKQNLYNLVDDKKFKDELTSFRVDKESDMILHEHRDDFIPVVMRIVYSKMISKVGTNTKGGGQLRRSLVLRFLAGCHEQELTIFINMAFKIFSELLQDDVCGMCESIIANTDLGNIIPPKRLLSAVNLLEVVREQFGGLIGEHFTRHLLKVLLCIGSIVNGVLTRPETLHSGYLGIMKNIRIMCLQSLTKFFSHFDSFMWTTKEIDSIFTVFIWPWLGKLSFEGIHSPTALLKLFLVWSSNPRYYALLAKHHDNDKTLSPLPNIMALLLGNKTNPVVVSSILELVEKMLTLQIDEEELDKAPPIVVTNTVAIDKDKISLLSLSEKLNYGSCILLPFIPDILNRIKRKLSGAAKGKPVGRRELFILSRATELVWEPETSSTLLKLLLPLLVKRASTGAGEETLVQLVITLTNLVQKVENPQDHIKAICPLFNEIDAIVPRKLLCKLIDTIAANAVGLDHLKTTAKVINELNAWDSKWIEQPDFDRRLEAFKLIDEMTNKNEIDIDLGALIIYNCFHFVRTEKDMSLRDTAGFQLRKMIPLLAVKYQGNSKDSEFLISTTILQLIRNSLRNKNDNVRNEAISLLGEMVRECPDVHRVLKDLAPLANKTDREVDFFDNLQHLQTHRKVRALLKFCTISKEMTKVPSPRTLTQFILPLASTFLCHEKTTGKNTLIDAAIETVGTVCRLLPWHQYETILKFYLGKLRHSVEFQKQIVRLVVAILDGFHFDLSKAESIKIDKNIDLSKPSEDTKVEVIEDSIEADSEDRKDDSLDQALDTVNEEINELTESIAETETTLAINRQFILPQSAAKRLIHTITTGLLPQLNRAISQTTSHDNSHKLNRKRTGAEREEEDILRVPIALALVKLLQKLPKRLLENNLPGILMKLCTFLKSPLREVRLVTRDILKKIMSTLGPSHLDTLLDQLTTLLTRGFHVHVLVATVHDVLETLKNSFQVGDMDRNLQSILKVCKEDLYGNASEEKDVEKLGHKTPEAKPSRKSFGTLQIVAQCITESCLLDLLIPFKEVLTTSHSKKAVLKTQECLAKIVQGLVDNKFVQIESLLMFLYGTASESIPELLTGIPKRVLTEVQREKMKRAKPDCFLIAQAPRGPSGAIRKVVKTNTQTNAHVIVEFGLGLLQIILKQEKLKGGDYRPFLDPLVPILYDALRSSHVKVTTLSLKCLCCIWTFKMNLPKMHEMIKDISHTIFNLLHKYATAGLSKKDDNFHLVKNGFKTMTALVRHVKYFMIDTDQLKTLLLYAEQDLHDYDRQSTAFSLLKSIISAKLIVPEMHEVMDKVAKLSIIAELPKVREESRMVFVSFLMDYPLGKKLEKHVQFYISQLNYEMQPGRESAIKMLHSIIHKFPEDVLSQYSGLLFLSLGARLVNDESADCRMIIAQCIESLLSRLPANDREALFDLVIVLMKDKKVSHREMAAQLCSRFVTVEKEKFKDRLDKLLPLIEMQLSNTDNDTPGKFVRLSFIEDENENEMEINTKERARDHHCIQVLKMILKLCEHCPFILTDCKYSSDIDNIAQYSQKLLAYPHVWVRLEAAKILECVIASLNMTELRANINIDECESNRGFLYYNTAESVKSLVLDLCAQLQPGDINTEFAEQISKNLIYIANLLKDLNTADIKTIRGDGKIQTVPKISLMWLIRRMRYVVNAEITKTPSNPILRTAVFNWIEGVITLLDAEQLKSVAQQLLAPLVREMADTDKANTSLRQQSNRLGKRIKNKIGDDEFNRIRMLLNSRLSIKRADRKKVKAQEKINDPVKAAKRKLNMQQKKKKLKKVRMEEMKGKRQYAKKRPRKEVDLEDK